MATTKKSTSKKSGTIEKWRLLNSNGNPVQWYYRRKSGNSKKKGFESFGSRQGRNIAINKILEVEPWLKVVIVKDTKQRKK